MTFQSYVSYRAQSFERIVDDSLYIYIYIYKYYERKKGDVTTFPDKPVS